MWIVAGRNVTSLGGSCTQLRFKSEDGAVNPPIVDRISNETMITITGIEFKPLKKIDFGGAKRGFRNGYLPLDEGPDGY